MLFIFFISISCLTENNNKDENQNSESPFMSKFTKANRKPTETGTELESILDKNEKMESFIDDSTDTESLITEQRRIPHFEGICTKKSVNVIITQGTFESIKVQASPNIIHQVETFVKNQILYISIKGSIKITQIEKVTVYVTLKNLREIEASGSSIIKGRSDFKSKKLNIKISESSTLFLQTSSEKVDMSISGSSEVTFSGNVKNLFLNISGSSKLKLKMKGQKIDSEISDESNVILSGKVNKAITHVSGASKLTAPDMEISEADVYLNGSSSANMNVLNKIAYEVTGSSFLKYASNPRIVKSICNNASSVKRIRSGL